MFRIRRALLTLTPLLSTSLGLLSELANMMYDEGEPCRKGLTQVIDGNDAAGESWQRRVTCESVIWVDKQGLHAARAMRDVFTRSRRSVLLSCD